MNILVSACLLGVLCRYDGQEKNNPGVVKLMGRHTLIPVCPEQAGGMMTLRPPSERHGAQVVNRENGDVTAYYEKGTEQTLKLARLYHCEYAILKERSPFYGKGHIYDGTFTDTLAPGDGIAAALLTKHGIKVIGEGRISQVFGNDKGGNNDELGKKQNAAGSMGLVPPTFDYGGSVLFRPAGQNLYQLGCRWQGDLRR